ncbi:dATP/dGTP pyrophosphohydrolase domain-containing protein [Bradyrhizobium sp. SZCCHNS1054]|uniref:dATP/dGTP pyrophosphohydrolase domain-containing protein n=1 Tax=Bradyrhizobium sp. SZCCHNS1054 TaxID=3057301 RepID=UPI002916DC66|nr:dATP/dGTP pyrophosphohydrolase domain-containing protein [Bradyrhizobium sp. SZCCHNS1054]
MFDLVAHLYRQRAFSRATFGPGERTKGVIDHIRKELVEIEKAPADVTEWVDVILLALDGAWRSGYSPEAIADVINVTQSRNELRDWPDWRTADPDKAIEHKREIIGTATITVTNTPRAGETAEQAYARTSRSRESFRAARRAHKRLGDAVPGVCAGGQPRAACLFPRCECAFEQHLSAPAGRDD